MDRTVHVDTHPAFKSYQRTIYIVTDLHPHPDSFDICHVVREMLEVQTEFAF
jgi:hypothetical protein